MQHPSSAALLADPRWLAHRYDPTADQVHFALVDRADRAARPFLTDANFPADTPVTTLPRAVARAEAQTTAPLHLILHSAFCCSTLLANVLDLPGAITTLKEPVILNDLVGWRHRGARPDAVAGMLDQALTLLARPFGSDRAVIVKPSNVVNGLARAMLGMRPAARALLLYTPLRDFLASIARKGMEGRLWARDLLAKQLLEGYVDFGFAPEDYLRLTDLQAAAVGWLAQADHFARLVAADPTRARTLDSEVLLARPAAVIAALDEFMGLGLTAQQQAAMLASPAFGTDAKSGAAFASGQRRDTASAAAALYADEIDKVAIWAEAVAANAGVALTPPGALLG